VLNDVVARVTDTIVERSETTRANYLKMIADQPRQPRKRLSCGNFAHGFAAAGADKARIKSGDRPNIAVVTSYNDVLSAHTPYRFYPDIIKRTARECGATAQVAGGVPAMCDGVTQGQAGMELSLFSRDTIALSTAVSLSHAMFDGALLLGICDKIVPGLLMGALRFGHLPVIMVPGGPMPTGLSHKEKIAIRERFAQGLAPSDALLEAESATYHTEGTCTFYGTANSNQMMMEAMGLHVPGAAFIPPGTELRRLLTEAAVKRILEIGPSSPDYRPLAHCIDERAIVNAMIILLATGGSTNHTIHLPAIARCAGIKIDWDDFAALSSVVPLLARIYPNGPADVNAFQAEGGPGAIIGELLKAGLLHRNIKTIWDSFCEYAATPVLRHGALDWQSPKAPTANTVIRTVAEPFQKDGGLKILNGNIGRAVIKTSAVDPMHWTIEAQALVFEDQDVALRALLDPAFVRDAIIVLRFQGPAANGMPELHKLTPALGVLQDRGLRVALLTDGRMSGASGKVPAAIHVSPEAALNGTIALIQDGDLIRICAREETLQLCVSADTLKVRQAAARPLPQVGCGRELFGNFRRNSSVAEAGASSLLVGLDELQ